MKRALPIVACVIANIIFGTTLYAITLATRAVDGDTYKLLSVRFIIATFLFSLPVMIGKVKVNYKGKPMFYPIILAILNPLIAFATEAIALTVMPSSQFGVMVSLTPIMLLVLSVFMLKEYPTIIQVVFTLFSVGGVFIINLSDSGEGINPYGLLMVFLNLAVNCFYKIYIRKLANVFTTYELTYLITMMGAVIFTIISLTQHALSGNVSGYFKDIHTAEFLLPTVYLAFGATVVAMMLINYSIANLPIVLTGVLSNILPVVAVVVGVYALGESFSMADVIGSAVILSGVLGVSLLHSDKSIAKKRSE